jgi:hypothetical protein
MESTSESVQFLDQSIRLRSKALTVKKQQLCHVPDFSSTVHMFLPSHHAYVSFWQMIDPWIDFALAIDCRPYIHEQVD